MSPEKDLAHGKEEKAQPRQHLGSHGGTGGPALPVLGCPGSMEGWGSTRNLCSAPL